MRARISIKQPVILALTAIIVAVSLLSVLALAQSISSLKFEAESGSALSGAAVAGDTGASGGSYLSFGGGTTSSSDFIETFSSPTSFDRFEHGLSHRDDFLVSQTEWQGDHSDLGNGNCGNPVSTSRTVHRSHPEESFYLCTSVDGDASKAHLMTSVGDTSGYSIAWFKPKQTFSNKTTVSFDVNATYLGTRQWWEVMITPVSGPDLACAPGFTACGIDPTGYPDDAITLRADIIHIDGTEIDIWGITNYCYGVLPADPEGCNSRTIRRPFVLTDNKNGTITLSMPAINQSFTYPGRFPPGEWKVVFKDHNYTPDKDGIPVGYTWHWDNIQIK
jgi:hypothetical protein